LEGLGLNTTIIPIRRFFFVAGDFDLLGDPIPEGFGRRGRPPHLVTEEKRNKVMLLCALDWSSEKIAQALGITPPTLRKNYFRELRSRLDARARLEASLLAGAFGQAAKGNVGAMKLIDERLRRHDLQRAAPVPTAKAEKLGKKEAALAKAKAGPTSSTWRGLVN
jgi:hypothetical protein